RLKTTTPNIVAEIICFPIYRSMTRNMALLLKRKHHAVEDGLLGMSHLVLSNATPAFHLLKK
ncbi:MAG: hypothetical protein AB8F34_15245, partial [Akkermansiaceae bacterium]